LRVTDPSSLFILLGFLFFPSYHVFAAVGSNSLFSIILDNFSCVAWFLAYVESMAAQAADAIQSSLVAEIACVAQVFSVDYGFLGLCWRFMAARADPEDRRICGATVADPESI